MPESTASARPRSRARRAHRSRGSREFLREPEAVFWVFAFPVIMTCALGIAFRSRGAEPVIVGVVEQAGDAPRLRDARSSAPAASPSARSRRTRSIARCATAARRWSSCRARRRPIASTTARAESQVARLAVDAALQRAAGRTRRVHAPRERPVDRVGSRYIDWLVPGLLGMNIMSTGLWGVGFCIVQARTRKLLKRLVATPMSRARLPAVARPQPARSSSPLEVGRPGRLRAGWRSTSRCAASLVALAASRLVGALSFGGLGLLVASRARDRRGVSGLMNLVMLPMWVLSGVFFASTQLSRRDAAVHSGAAADGADRRAARRVIRRASAASLGSELAILGGLGQRPFALALRLFRWQ